MSNARSPREVCSTTIGTSGLTVLASFRVWRPNPSRRATCTRSSRRESSARVRPPNLGLDGRSGHVRRGVREGPRAPLEALSGGSGAGRPELPGAGALALLAGRPELLARLRLLDADRLRRLREEVER